MVSNSSLTLVVLIVLTLCMVSSSYYFIKFVYRLRLNGDDIGPTCNAYITLACYSFTSLYLLSDIIHCIDVYIHDYPFTHFGLDMVVINTIGSAFYFISTTIIYIILIYRLYFIFKDSIFEVHLWVLIFFSFLISISVLFMIGYLCNITLSSMG
eukprot:396928_1